jgi:uncharacterized lipoprotein YmbA
MDTSQVLSDEFPAISNADRYAWVVTIGRIDGGDKCDIIVVTILCLSRKQGHLHLDEHCESLDT